MLRLFCNCVTAPTPVSTAERFTFAPLRERGSPPIAGCLVDQRSCCYAWTPRCLAQCANLTLPEGGVIFRRKSRDTRNISFLYQVPPVRQCFFRCRIV